MVTLSSLPYCLSFPHFLSILLGSQAISAPAVKKPRYMGKLVAAALPMKAGAAAAGGVASKPAVSNKTLAKNGGTPSVLPATAKGANGISSAAAIVDKEVRW